MDVSWEAWKVLGPVWVRHISWSGRGGGEGGRRRGGRRERVRKGRMSETRNDSRGWMKKLLLPTQPNLRITNELTNHLMP